MGMGGRMRCGRRRGIKYQRKMTYGQSGQVPTSVTICALTDSFADVTKNNVRHSMRFRITLLPVTDDLHDKALLTHKFLSKIIYKQLCCNSVSVTIQLFGKLKKIFISQNVGSMK